MNESFENYIDKVIYNIAVTGKKASQIKEDLYVSLLEKQKVTGENDPYMLLGDPEEIAAEFRENLGIKDSNISINFNKKHLDYISKTKIFGVPLVHVSTNPFKIAKGVFSFGFISTGIFSFGLVSFGILSFGVLSLGLIVALGAISISALLANGGVALAYGMSLGGVAIAKHIAIGGYVRADIAIGGVAHGVISVFHQNGTGTYLFKAPTNPDDVISCIKQVYPKINEIILKFIKLFI
ncbi:hypothetical protein SAMN02745163_01834 [Clostridium cavendishii DSM 21758]|uniref:Uncharacterized protein n=1 Tax=Clostridium cavendishii DSM 21758 TaxID=1121302 RepID=A0A1M6IVX2_9CLOT|nr:hypothetical protein [Clostridium cavendishii]SHJ38577.1 hypothetical protein SAMN02745163_01834 [Clostridium cavendishii DSM 21758]